MLKVPAPDVSALPMYLSSKRNSTWVRQALAVSLRAGSEIPASFRLLRQQVGWTYWAFCTPRGESYTTVGCGFLLVLMHGSPGGCVYSPGMAVSNLACYQNTALQLQVSHRPLIGSHQIPVFPRLGLSTWFSQETVVSGCHPSVKFQVCICRMSIKMPLILPAAVQFVPLLPTAPCLGKIFPCLVHTLGRQGHFSPAPALGRHISCARQSDIWKALSSHWSCDLNRGFCCIRIVTLFDAGTSALWCNTAADESHMLFCRFLAPFQTQFAFLSKLLLLRALPWDLCSRTANTSRMDTWIFNQDQSFPAVESGTDDTRKNTQKI